MNQIDDLYVAFSPNNPKSQHYAQLLDQGIAKLKQYEIKD